MVRHSVSFAPRMHAARSGLADDLQSHLMASFARLDIPAIMAKVSASSRVCSLQEQVGVLRWWGLEGVARRQRRGRQQPVGCRPPGAPGLAARSLTQLLDRPQVEAALPAYQSAWRRQAAEQGGPGADGGGASSRTPEEVDLETVLWTDPDVLFRRDISSCSLPAPRLLSIGPEVRRQ